MLTAIAALAGLLTVTSITADPHDGVTVEFVEAIDVATAGPETIRLVDETTHRTIPTHIGHARSVNDVLLRPKESISPEHVYRVVVRGQEFAIRFGNPSTTPGATVGYIGPLTRVSISAQLLTTCATDTHYHVWCWGFHSPALGISSNVDVVTPTQVPLFDNVYGRFGGNSGDADQRCIQASPGWAPAGWFCWGRDYVYAASGHGGFNDVFWPTGTVSTDGGVQVTHATLLSCMRYANDTISCTGTNDFGAQGNGGFGGINKFFTPIIDPGPWFDVGAGTAHECAIDGGSDVWCWGWNDEGQLGDGTKNSSGIPVKVRNLTNARHVIGGLGYSCALLFSGIVKCWGNNDNGELGDGTKQASLSPVTVQGLHDVVQLVGGYRSSCALKTDGTAWCWGYNIAGQVGDVGWGFEVPTPMQVPIPVVNTPQSHFGDRSRLLTIAVGFSHACALRSDAVVFCWGSNGSANSASAKKAPAHGCRLARISFRKRELLGLWKHERQHGVGRVDASIVVPALGDDVGLVLGAELLVDVLHVRFAARASRGALRHRRAR